MRKARLVDCNPRWGMFYRDGDNEGRTCFVTFDCPEGHDGCHHTVPFTPALDESVPTHAGAVWIRSGTTFEHLSLSPSIKRTPRFASREAAIAEGADPDLVTPSLLCAMHVVLTCAMHVVLTDGMFTFGDDAR